MKPYSMVNTLLVTLLLLTGCATTTHTPVREQVSKLDTAVSDQIGSIEGTTWAGKDSDGDFYEYTFLIGGQLLYKTNTSRQSIVTFEDKGDVWAQNGKTVIILIGDTSANVGTLLGDRIEGKAWNATGRRWTWEVKKK